MKEFTKQYQLSKTLRFELRPVGKTTDNLKKDDVFMRDRERAGAYPKVKEKLDDGHKALLQRVFSDADANIKGWFESLKSKDAYTDKGIISDGTICWEYVANAITTYRNSKKEDSDRKKLNETLSLCRKILVEILKADEQYINLTESTPSKYIKDVLKNSGDQNVDLKKFEKFASYFVGYQENRKNIYSDKAQSTAAAFRAVDENFYKFMEMVRISAILNADYPQIISDVESELSSLLQGKSLNEIFSYSAYSNYLSQRGIEYLNNVIGGISLGNCEKKRGVNEFINLYLQQHPEDKRKISIMPMLYKQILSDRDTTSFIPDAFVNDTQVLNAICEFNAGLDSAEIGGVYLNVIEELKGLLSRLSSNAKIYVCADEITRISAKVCGSWSAIDDALSFANEAAAGGKKKSKKSEKKKNEYSLKELCNLKLVKVDADDNETSVSVLDYWTGDYVSGLFDRITQGRDKVVSIPKDAPNLKENKDNIAVIKDYLDALQELLHCLKPFNADEALEKDSEFYSLFDGLYAELEKVVPLYNSIRNYATKKVGEVAKIKLNFDCTTLANGWDANKENDNKCVIFEKDGLYYLGIIAKGAKVDFTTMVAESTSSCYRKLVYKYLPSPNKMFPKVFFAESNLAKYNPSETLLDNYRKGVHKTDKAFSHMLIDFFKKSIKLNEDWNVFDFKFSQTSMYSGMDAFYSEVEEQNYKLNFVNIPTSEVDNLVEEGKLYLFQIYNKDFSSHSKGTPNMHTLYWKALFDPENLEDVIFKLNGEAELFLRDPSIKNPTVHKVGEKVVNRTDKNDNPIPEEIHNEIFMYANNRLNKPLSADAKRLIDSNLVTIKEVKNNAITKDKRYTEQKMLFHVPLTINFKSADRATEFNERVAEYLRDNPDVKIIGIDRGERHLIYISLIDQQGNILEQKSFNVIESVAKDGKMRNFNYHDKLAQSERERNIARKSWSEIGQIKDLKSGFLSQVVHVISKMMIENNAIIVMEDLNFGFKRGRFKIERQVYQKFEKALIEKLNYLVFKNEADQFAPGGLLNGYQLTTKFSSFKEMGKQCGFLFYVPAAYTSKIDPTTGFANLFKLKDNTNASSRKEFLQKFESIKYDSAQKAFAFTFDYSKFKTSAEDAKKKWTVYSASKRIVYDKNNQQTHSRIINPTEEICNALEARGIALDGGFDLKDYLDSIGTSSLADVALINVIYHAFAHTLQMRNSNTERDYIASPVMNKNGAFYKSDECGKELTKDADANGAYHIALKGLYLLRNAFDKPDKPNLKIENKDWFKFVQELKK